MDPISIAAGACSLATVAVKISKGIYDGVQALKSADRRLLSLSKEVSALGHCLAAVQASLEDKRLLQFEQSLNLPGSLQPAFFDSIRRILSDCVNDLFKLDDVLFGIKKESSTPKFLRKSSLAIKLSLNADDIAESRNSIQVDIAALQVLLSSSSLNMYVTL
jgi:hypothetical protein